MHKHQSNGGRGLFLMTMGVCSQESIELFAGRIKGALFLLGEAAMDQWPLVMGDDLQDQLNGRAPPEFWGLVDVTNNFATEQPQIVAVQVAGLARQTLTQQVQQERGERRNDLLAGNDVTFFATPTCRPSRQIRAVGGQVWRDYDGSQFFLEFVWHASDLDIEPVLPLPRLRLRCRTSGQVQQQHRSRGPPTPWFQSEMLYLPPPGCDLRPFECAPL